jgi:GNAT superfamily N-acetyltransferase
MPAAGSRFDLEELNVINAIAFRTLAYQAHQQALMQLTPDSPVIAIGAIEEGRPAGLVLMEARGDKSAILSICTATEFRNRGIATELLRAAEHALKERKAASATLTYVTGKATTPALERLLEKCGWPAAEPKHLHCWTDNRIYPWLADYKLPESFEIFPWVDITVGDRLSLERSQAAENWVPESVWPFSFEGTLEPNTSLGVRYGGELVGWVLTQERPPNALCYACSYMRPDLQRRGRLIGAYAEAVRRQIEFTDKTVGIWIVPYKHPAMAAFVLRRMKPHLVSLQDFRESRKEFA